MRSKVEKYWNYAPIAFWSMDNSIWTKYVNNLEEDDRDTLSYFPFKWSYVPPHDAKTAKLFLEDISVGSEDIGLDAIESQFEKLPKFEDLISSGTIQWSDREYSDTPGTGFRMIPEWEPMAGTILNWPVFYPPLWETFRQMISALDHVTTFLRIPEGYLGASVLVWLEKQGIDLTEVKPIPGPIGDIWARDYSAVYGVNPYTGEALAHKFTFAAFYPEYREQFKSVVEIDDRFIWTEGFEVRRSEIMFDGGNILTDGDGTYFLTRRILTDNHSVPNLTAKLKAWLGADRIFIFDEEPGDILGHICNFKLIGPEKAVVGLPDKDDTPLAKYLVKIRKMFVSLDFEVIDVPCGDGFQHVLPDGYNDYPGAYANSLIVNKRLLLPIYDRKDMEMHNTSAIEAYKAALTGFEIMPIDASILGNGGGAINCSTKEVPKVK